MFLKKVIFCINALFLVSHTSAQENNIPIGEWRVHLPYTISNSVEVTENATYSAADVNAFFIDHTDHSSTILSTINALSDIEITKIKYHKGLKLLVIAYLNGNMDIIKDNISTNINDIKRKNIIGSKRINHIHFQNDLAYISCDFGLTVLNLKKYEIKETYTSLAPGGLSNKVYATTFSSDGDSIFIATERGVMTAKSSPGVNLMDYSNWYTYGSSNNITTNNIRAICTLKNKIYVGISGDSISYLNGNQWIKTPMLVHDIRSINVSEEKMIACGGASITVADNETNHYVIYNPWFIPAPSEAVFDGNNNLWIGDLANGLYQYNNATFTSHRPNGPSSRDAFHLDYINTKMIVSRGGHSSNYGFIYKLAEYYIFDNYTWQTYNHASTPGFPNVADIINATYNPHDNKYYFPIYGNGVMALNPDNTYSIITGPPFISSFSTNVRITDVEPDIHGNLWFTNAFTPLASDPSLHVLRSDGSWGAKKFHLPAARYPVEILIDDNNYKWVRLRGDQGGGVIVYDDEVDRFKYLTDLPGQGGLPLKGVRAMAKDKKGEIWLGTEGGIAIFYNPIDIFSASPPDASIPIFDGFPLLYNEHITCIEVDGGNRKWIGTKNGLWLFNDDGTEVITNFTTENSPLLSNNIMDVEINDITGEVFISTEKGLISYRGLATEGTVEHSEVKVFPNPVKPDFTGLVGISGLTTDAIVKITDIYGNLIYETKAEGGTAVWNAKNYNGQKAKTGVYLIFSSSEDGAETFVSKIAVIE